MSGDTNGTPMDRIIAFVKWFLPPAIGADEKERRAWLWKDFAVKTILAACVAFLYVGFYGFHLGRVDVEPTVAKAEQLAKVATTLDKMYEAQLISSIQSAREKMCTAQQTGNGDAFEAYRSTWQSAVAAFRRETHKNWQIQPCENYIMHGEGQ